MIYWGQVGGLSDLSLFVLGFLRLRGDFKTMSYAVKEGQEKRAMPTCRGVKAYWCFTQLCGTIFCSSEKKENQL